HMAMTTSPRTTTKKGGDKYLSAFLDPASAHHAILLVKDDGLARSYSALGLVKFHRDAIRVFVAERGCRSLVPVADLGLYPHRFDELFTRNPVKRLGNEPLLQQVLLRSNHHTAIGHVSLEHVKRLAHRDTQPFALAHGKMMNPTMLT